jgi:TetR/AcrR family transcriptional repressor of lmrAB and yxaGH operons
MPAQAKSREAATRQVLELFRNSGYDGTSLSDITAAIGLGKGSLYHYFPGGKAEMASAVLKLVDEWFERTIIEPLGDAKTQPRVRLTRMLKALDAFYEGGARACILERLCASVDRKRFARPLARVFGGWVDALERLASEAGLPTSDAHARAEDAVLRIEGALILAAGLGDTGPFARTLHGIEESFLSA